MASADANDARRRAAPPEGSGSVDFSAEFHRSYRVLWTIAAGILGRPDDAADVVQESALLALEKQQEFRTGSNFTAWLAQIVRFVALNHGRKRQRHRATSLESQPLDSLGSAPTSAGESLDRLGRLLPGQDVFDDEITAALLSVGEIPRACLLLRTLENLEYDEISRLLGIPAGTAMSHVFRTRALLRRVLADRDPSPAARKDLGDE